MTTNFETINRNKFIVGGAIVFAVGWGALKYQVADAVDTNIAQDKAIEKLKDQQSHHDMENVDLKANQRHLKESLNKIEKGQEKILGTLLDIEKRLP